MNVDGGGHRPKPNPHGETDPIRHLAVTEEQTGHFDECDVFMRSVSLPSMQ